MVATSRKRNLRAVGIGSHHHLAEFLGRFKAPGGLNRIGKLRTRRCRSPSDLAGGNQDILLLDRSLDIANGQIELGELVRLHPNAHGVFGEATPHHFRQAHTANSRQFIDNIERGIVGQKLFVRRIPLGETSESNKSGKASFFLTVTPCRFTSSGRRACASDTRFCVNTLAHVEVCAHFKGHRQGHATVT